MQSLSWCPEFQSILLQATYTVSHKALHNSVGKYNLYNTGMYEHVSYVTVSSQSLQENSLNRINVGIIAPK